MLSTLITGTRWPFANQYAIDSKSEITTSGEKARAIDA